MEGGSVTRGFLVIEPITLQIGLTSYATRLICFLPPPPGATQQGVDLTTLSQVVLVKLHLLVVLVLVLVRNHASSVYSSE